MGRSRSRSRSRTDSRSRSRSAGSSSASDSEEREIEQEERAERKLQRKEQREAARKLRELKAAQEAQEQATGAVQWVIKDTINTYKDDDDDDDDEEEGEETTTVDASIMALCGKRPAGAPETVKDCKEWAPLEEYLREYFEVHASQKKIALKLKFMSAKEVEGEDILYGTVRDESTMANWWNELGKAVKRGGAAQKIVKAQLIGLKEAVKIARKRRPPTERAEKEKEKFGSLVRAVYGEQPGHFAEGEWCVEASDIVRREPATLKKYLAMCPLTAKVSRGAPPPSRPPLCSQHALLVLCAGDGLR
jgi:hypothetical protein